MTSVLFIAESANGEEMENKHDDNHQIFSKHKVFDCLFFQDYLEKWENVNVHE